jgi:site-specific recombinase XerD
MSQNELVLTHLPAIPAERVLTQVVTADTHLSPEAIDAVVTSRPDSTRRAYAADRKAYHDWCATHGRTVMPATPETMTEYATHLAGTPRGKDRRSAAPSSIERAMSAITTWHEEYGHPKPVMKGARAVINGYKERLATTKDPAARPRKASPAVPTALRAMLADLDRATLAGARDAALVLVGFATAARMSELVSLDVADIRTTATGLDTSLYRRKIRAFTDNAVLYGSHPATCPVRAVLAYLDMLAEAGRSGPLFMRIDRHGRLAPPLTRKGQPIGGPDGRLTAQAAGQVVARLADRAGLDGEWSGHSLRRGFATAARRAGHDLVRIGRTGGWADGSRALLGYMEDVDRVTDSPLIGIGL